MEKEKPQMVLYGGLKMNKIRVIDLLNKIANGEEVPKKFKYRNYNFIYLDGDYSNLDTHEYFSECYLFIDNLTDEIELIEEDKEIEEIKSHYVLGLDESLERVIEWQKENNKIYEDKINELIKAVNEIKKGK